MSMTVVELRLALREFYADTSRSRDDRQSGLEQVRNDAWSYIDCLEGIHSVTIPVTAAMVGQLRDVSDEPMMQCKKALVACHGNMVAAEQWLRTRTRNLA